MFQMKDNQTEYIQTLLNQMLPGSLIRYLDYNQSTTFQAYIPLIDCADVAINAASAAVEFVTPGNYKFSMNQALFRQDGDDCLLMVTFTVNATSDLLILGAPAFHNTNISVDFDNSIIGLSNGINLTPIQINYTPRVAILMVVFTLIALCGFCLSRNIDDKVRR